MNIESLTAVPLLSTPSLNDLPIDCPRPDLSNRAMSLPHVKKRLQAFRRDSVKRRKVARDSAVSFQLEDDQATPSATSPAPDNIKDQPTVAAVPQVPSPTRKRILVQKWLLQQSERIGRLKLRYDSVFRSEDIQKELKSASEDANTTVEGPHGEPLPAYVVDHFFKLYSAGGSDWRDSRRWAFHLRKWEDHTRDCFQGDCSYCKTMRKAGERAPPPYIPPSLPTPHLSSLNSPNSPKRQRGSENSYFSISLWRRKSCQQKEKGKAPALGGECNSLIDEALISPRTQTPGLPPVRPRAPRAPENSIIIRETIQRQRRKPVRWSESSIPLDPRQIPVLAVPDLWPAESNCLDLSDLSHVTGRPYGTSPLEEGQSSFPLAKNFMPPPTPQLKPKQRLTPIPEPLRLGDSARAPSSNGLFDTSPFASASPSAANLQQGGFRPTVRLVSQSTTTPESAFTALMSQYDDGLSTPRSEKRKPSAATSLRRSPAPAVQPLPTTPESRNNNVTNPSAVPYASNGSVVPPSAGRMRVPDGPADRDWKTCKLSDTTGSPLPDCPVYVHPREARDARTASMAKRHWPGNCIWR